MKQLMIDINKCINCHACEIACKQENNIPVGIRWIRVHEVEYANTDRGLSKDFVVTMCRHCMDPLCMKVCPEDAINRRLDGIVLIDREKCSGCKLCVEACSFGVIQYNLEKNKVEKCNMCVHRIDKGLRPACVIHCPTKALQFAT